MADDNPIVTEAERAQQRVDARQVDKHAPAADDEDQDRNSERLEVGPMDQTTAQAGGEALEMRDGEDFVCPNCGCEIMLKHHGDPAKMPEMGAFRCCCGTAMHPEHPREH